MSTGRRPPAPASLPPSSIASTPIPATLQAMDRRDAVLGDDSVATLRCHYAQHGTTRDAAALLSERYDGEPDMIRALVDWSNLYTDGHTNLHMALKKVLLEHEQTLVPRLDDALAVSNEALPVIRGITASPVWRGVVGDMAARKKDSTLHNLLTREARLVEAGIGQEVLATPRSFMDALVEQFRAVFTKENTSVGQTDLVSFYRRVSALCTYDECSTIVALRLFETLSRSTEDALMRGVYRRVGQEVRREAVNVMTAAGIVDGKMAREYMVRLAVLTDAVASGVQMNRAVLEALLNVVGGDKGGRKRSDQDVKVLKDVYGRLIGSLDIGYDGDEVVETGSEWEGGGLEEKAVLIRALCHVEVFEDLVSSLFSHERRTYVNGNPDVGKRQGLSMLLGYAGVFICLDQREISTLLRNEQMTEQFRRNIKTMYERIVVVAETCEELKPGCPRYKIKGKAVETLLGGVEDPLLARGIFLWAKEGLQGGTDLRALMVTAVKHLAFLEAIAQKHPILRSQVLEAIQVAFLREYPGLDSVQTEELRDKFMKTITDMVKVQMGPFIVQVFLDNWADNDKVDKAHLRRFVTRLLQTISPPYSPSFARSVVQLLDNKRVASSIETEADVQESVAEFRRQAAHLGVV